MTSSSDQPRNDSVALFMEVMRPPTSMVRTSSAALSMMCRLRCSARHMASCASIWGVMSSTMRRNILSPLGSFLTTETLRRPWNMDPSLRM